MMDGTIHGRIGPVSIEDFVKGFSVSQDDDLIILDALIGSGHLEFELPVKMAKTLIKQLTKQIKAQTEE